MCNRKNSVLFTDTECVVLSPDFKLPDENYVLLRVSRKNNMYSVDLKNIIPKVGLTCLFAKVTSDESILWHRRLGHLNFKTMNKLVKGNLVNEALRQENECNDQEEEDGVNITTRVNAFSSIVNVASNEVNVVGRKASIELLDDLNMPELEDISISEDLNEDVFVARIESIRLFLAYTSLKDFVVYQMDVKSSFLYGKIENEVYVCQHLGFEDLDFPKKVYKVEKALYGLHQASREWYESLSTYLLDNGFQRGKIDKTLFIRRHKGDILLVQVYVDDIIFGSTKKELCTSFEKLMHDKFQMSSMGDLTFFLRLQVKQKEDDIFISQDKYVAEILKKFRFFKVKTASTCMETQKHFLKDKDEEEVDVHIYRSMIDSLMYITSSRPDIIFIVCACARYQVNPKMSHLHACKKQNVVVNTTTEAEYVDVVKYSGFKINC
nr:putative ribonuclease H-like domain-containing protein [Tanacetum cinerariifolium]